METPGPRKRKTLLPEGGLGSLRSTRCWLSNANEKQGLSPGASAGLPISVAILRPGCWWLPSDLSLLLRKLLLKGCTRLIRHR